MQILRIPAPPNVNCYWALLSFPTRQEGRFGLEQTHPQVCGPLKSCTQGLHVYLKQVILRLIPFTLICIILIHFLSHLSHFSSFLFCFVLLDI